MKPIETLPLFEDLNQELIYFLADLNPAEWQQQSLIEGLRVKDITSQLIYTSLRRISIQRDHFLGDEMKEGLSNALKAKDNLMAETIWGQALRQISPRLLVEMLKKYEQEVYELLSRLRLDELSEFSHGDGNPLPNWLEISQIYAHKWLKQTLLRQATGRLLLMSERFLVPWYETVLLSLPEYLNKMAASYPDQTLDVDITGEIRLRNRLQKFGPQWRFVESGSDAATTGIKIPASVGWLLFSGVDSDFQKHKAVIENHGDEALMQLVLQMRPSFL